MTTKPIKRAIKLDCVKEIWFENDRFDHTFSTSGYLYCVADDIYILAFDDLEADAQITLKISANQLSFVSIGNQKTNNVHIRQTHALDEWYAVQYFVAGKSMVMRTLTKQLSIDIEDDGGCIELAYELYSGETCLGLYAMDIFFDL